MFILCKLVAVEEVAGIYFGFHVIEDSVVAVGDDGLALGLEGGEVVHHAAAEECAAVFEGWFVDDDFCAFGLDALHHTLDGRLAEVVAV